MGATGQIGDSNHDAIPRLGKRTKRLEKRIKELGEKSSQTLLFLSFALVVAATLKDKSASSQQSALRLAMWWWSWALFPILVGILPLKEIREGNYCWYCFLRWLKSALLWIAVVFIACGAYRLTQAI